MEQINQIELNQSESMIQNLLNSNNIIRKDTENQFRKFLSDN